MGNTFVPDGFAISSRGHVVLSHYCQKGHLTAFYFMFVTGDILGYKRQKTGIRENGVDLKDAVNMVYDSI